MDRPFFKYCFRGESKMAIESMGLIAEYLCLSSDKKMAN
jgi:hypothetical protein